MKGRRTSVSPTENGQEKTVMKPGWYLSICCASFAVLTQCGCGSKPVTQEPKTSGGALTAAQVQAMRRDQQGGPSVAGSGPATSSGTSGP